MASRIQGATQLSIGWKCSSCGELITRIEDGCVEWLASEGPKGTTRVKGMRLVHSLASSPRSEDRGGCQYDYRREFRKDRSIVEGLALESFVGVDGLMLLLSFIAANEMPEDEILELAKRVQIPGYEQTRELFHEATEQGVVAPSLREGYYLQSEIRALQQWATSKVL